MTPHRARTRGAIPSALPAGSPQSRQQHTIGDRFLLLFLGGFLAFTPPVLLTVNKPLMIIGVPLLYLWLAGVWLLLIIGVMRINKRLDNHTPDPSSPIPPQGGADPAQRQGGERYPQLPPLGD